MDSRNQKFDPNQVLAQQRQFAEQHGIDLSPHPQKIMTPEESLEKNMGRAASEFKQGSDDIAKYSLDGQEKELLIMTIEIGDGQKDTLRVFENDDPNDLAKEFCDKHGLNPNIVYPLAQNIYANMEQVLQERLEALNYGGNEYPEGKDQLQEYSKFPEQKTGGFREGDYEEDNQPTEQKSLDNQGDNIENQYDFETAETHKHPEYNFDSHQTKTLDKYDTNNPYGQNPIPYTYPPLGPHNHQQPAVNQSYDSKRYSTSKKGGASPNKTSGTNRTRTPDGKERKHNTDYPHEQAIKKSIYYPENFQTEEDYIEQLIQNQYSGSSKESGQGASELTFVPQINPNSRMILETKYQNNRLSVYDRLHNHAKLKNQKALKQQQSQQQSPRKSVNNTQTNINEINYGSLLYHKGLKRKEEISKQINDQRKEKIEVQEKECTFKPQINPISNEIMNNKPRAELTEDALIKLGKSTKEKLERARSIKKIQEIEECTFKPTINNISERIVVEKEKNVPAVAKNRYLRLFHDSKVRQAQQDMRSRAYHDECTFVPQTNNYQSRSIDNTTFEQRNKKFLEKNIKLEQQREIKLLEELIDPSTGRPYFQPQTGRGPKNGRYPQGVPIGEYLYNHRFEMENKQRDLLEKEQRTLEANMARSNEKSHLIMENIKKKKLAEIFSFLDSDGDGYISSTKIDIASVGTDILEALAPLLCEMEELGQTLSLADFMEAADKLLRTLSVAEKDRLLMNKREHDTSLLAQGYTFHPEINKKSQKIAENLRPYKNFDALYEVFLGEKKALEEKIKQEQERKAEEELRECSFKPVLLSNHSIPIIANHYYNPL